MLDKKIARAVEDLDLNIPYCQDRVQRTNPPTHATWLYNGYLETPRDDI